MIDDFLNGLALLETAGGAKTIKGPNGENSNNLYNIKDFSGKGGFKALDKAEGSRDAYRVYESPEQSKADALDLFSRKYPKALQAKTPEEFARALKAGGYATDPLYVTKLTRAINTAATPQGALKVYGNQGWDKDIAYAKSQGFSEAEIVAKIKESTGVKLPAVKSDKLDPQVARAISVDAAKGGSVISQIDKLRKAGWGNDIDYARKNGFSFEEIVSKIAGEDVAKGKAAYDKVQKRGFMGNLDAGTLAARDDVIMGTKQVWAGLTGDKKREAELRAQQANRQNTLDTVAMGTSGAASLGRNLTSAAPAIAGGLLAPVTGGSSLGLATLGGAAGGAAGGALGGALQPTTRDGQRTANAMVGAALGAAGPTVGVAGRAAARGVGAGTDKLLKAGLNEQAAFDRVNRYIAQGIDNPNMAEVFPNAARARNFAEDRLVGSTWFGANKGAARTEAQQRIIDAELGVKRPRVSPVTELLTKGPQFMGAFHTGGASLIPPTAIGQALTRRVTDPAQLAGNASPGVMAEMLGVGTGLGVAGAVGAPQSPADIDEEEIIRRYLAEKLARGQ